MTKSRKTLPQLSDEDVSRFCSVVGLGPRKLGEARAKITEKYKLGPRGAWIMGMIGEGVDLPSRMSDLLCIRRSLFTAELDRLVDAGLVKATRDQRDGRRLRLSLTARWRKGAGILAQGHNRIRDRASGRLQSG